MGHEFKSPAEWVAGREPIAGHGYTAEAAGHKAVEAALKGRTPTDELLQAMAKGSDVLNAAAVLAANAAALHSRLAFVRGALTGTPPKVRGVPGPVDANAEGLLPTLHLRLGAAMFGLDGVEADLRAIEIALGIVEG